jgi:LPXTG-motif cell wall-anchored protein
MESVATTVGDSVTDRGETTQRELVHTTHFRFDVFPWRNGLRSVRSVKFVVRPLLATVTLGVAMVVGVFAGAFAAGAPSVAAQAPAAPMSGAYVLHDLQCDQHDNGVLDLTLVNDDPANAAAFTVATSAKPSQYEVASLSARAITMTGLADGPVVVPVMVNGVSSDVSVTVACDPAQVEVLPPTVAPTTIVASSPPHPVAPPTTQAAISSPADGGFLLPSTGSSLRGLVIGGVLVVAGIAASLLARRRYG